MPSGGHNAKPLSVLKMEGTYRPDRQGQRGPRTGGEQLEKPSGLGPAGEWLWDEVVRLRGDWLASSDAAELEAMAKAWQYAKACEVLLDADPTDKDARCSWAAYNAAFSGLAARFGLTPADRARLGEGATSHQQRDELEGLLA